MIAENIERIKADLPAGVKLVAVSNIKPIEDIMDPLYVPVSESPMVPYGVESLGQ